MTPANMATSRNMAGNLGPVISGRCCSLSELGYEQQSPSPSEGVNEAESSGSPSSALSLTVAAAFSYIDSSSTSAPDMSESTPAARLVASPSGW